MIADCSDGLAELADQWFPRKPDAEKIVNASDTAGPKAPSRHDALVKYGVASRGHGLSGPALVAALHAKNGTYDEPKPADEVRAIARWCDREVELAPAERPLQIEHAEVVAAEPPEPIEYDIAAILPASDAPALMFGPPASLKSWLALGMCDASVRGVPFAGLATRKRPRALYLNLDAGAKTFRNRVRAVTSAPGLDFASLAAADFNADVLRAQLEAYAGGFVVIDCLSSIYNPDARKDPAFAMRTFVDGLRALYAEFDCGGVVIDHPHRPKERGELGDYHGSIQKEAAFRTMWSVVAEPAEADNATRRTKLSCRKLSKARTSVRSISRSSSGLAFRFDAPRSSTSQLAPVSCKRRSLSGPDARRPRSRDAPCPIRCGGNLPGQHGMPSMT